MQYYGVIHGMISKFIMEIFTETADRYSAGFSKQSE